MIEGGMTPVHRPLLMRGPLVRATHADLKTVTRRLDMRWLQAKPGDLIWVKETWAVGRGYDGVAPRDLPGPTKSESTIKLHRLADGEKPDWAGQTRVSIHMPKWVCRLWLEVVSVRAERLQDITEEDARREGAKFHDGRGVGHSGWRLDETDVFPTARDAFFGIWRRLHGEASLLSNPSVARIEFKRAERPALGAH